MLRQVVAIYLVLVTAAGPGFCCCSLTHLFARAPRSAGSPCLTSRSTRPRCCHRSTAGKHLSRGRNSAGDLGYPAGQHGSRDRECPCRQQASELKALPGRTPEVSDRAQSPLQVLALFPFDGLHRLLPVGGVAVLPGDLSPPFLAAQDLLRVHHQLRC